MKKGQKRPGVITGWIKISKITHFIEDKGLTKQQFADLCKIKLNDLNKVLDDISFFEPIVLLKIARTMGVDFSDLVNEKVPS